ncbi:hypothetical protein [uncultured Shewanella sp.]|uniref:hypothetical protein n=1 Tax=uncultured Shewanella sp. TaxID=173975 RepID=UPI002613DBC1|nr:hypothetical protein [uncultured Shewanella sp.]
MAKKSKNPYMVDYYRKYGVAVIPRVVLTSPRYYRLNYSAHSLLNYIAAQYNGHNNGDLSACLTQLRHYGFKSQDTLSRAIKALLANELIVRTRIGGKNFETGANMPSLYALTWQPINECNGKIDVRPTRKPCVDFIKEYEDIKK